MYLCPIYSVSYYASNICVDLCRVQLVAVEESTLRNYSPHFTDAWRQAKALQPAARLEDRRSILSRLSSSAATAPEAEWITILSEVLEHLALLFAEDSVETACVARMFIIVVTLSARRRTLALFLQHLIPVCSSVFLFIADSLACLACTCCPAAFINLRRVQPRAIRCCTTYFPIYLCPELAS